MVNSKAMSGVRAKRARIILEMGLIRREANTFFVGSPTQKNAQFKVWRDDDGIVCCSCPDFAELSATDQQFRCEHIQAVKGYLDQKKLNEAELEPGNQPIAPAVVVANPPQPTEIAELAATASPTGIGQTGEDSMAKKSESTQNRNQTQNQTQNQMGTEAGDQPNLAAVRNETAVDGHFEELLIQLSRPIPPNDIKRRFGWQDQQGNAHYVDYVEWHTVADLLDYACPTWSHSVKSVNQIGDFVAVTVAITIEGITREGVGTGPAYSEMGIKKAEHDALKRAAVKFGVARGLYRDEEEAEPKAQNFPHDPLARDLEDLVTPRQLVAIKAIAASAAVDADQACRELMKCDIKELSRKAASALIDYLKSKQHEEGDLRKAG